MKSQYLAFGKEQKLTQLKIEGLLAGKEMSKQKKKSMQVNLTSRLEIIRIKFGNRGTLDYLRGINS